MTLCCDCRPHSAAPGANLDEVGLCRACCADKPHHVERSAAAALGTREAAVVVANGRRRGQGQPSCQMPLIGGRGSFDIADRRMAKFGSMCPADRVGRMFSSSPNHWLLKDSNLSHFGYKSLASGFSAPTLQGRAHWQLRKMIDSMVELMSLKPIDLGSQVSRDVQQLKVWLCDVRLQITRPSRRRRPAHVDVDVDADADADADADHAQLAMHAMPAAAYPGPTP